MLNETTRKAVHIMRSMLKGTLGVLIAVLALGAVSASSASAHEWVWAASTPEWAQGGTSLSGAIGTKWKGNVKITDESLEVTVECADSGEGSAGPGAVDKVTTLTVSSCTPVDSPNCKTLESAKALDLPWNGDLTVVKSGGGVGIRNMITEESKDPGFSFECTTPIGKVLDTCIASALSTNGEDRTGGVEATFAREIPLNCSEGGKGKGRLEGIQSIEAVKGSALEVLSPFKGLTSAHKVTSAGELTIEDQDDEVGAKCHTELHGTVEADGKGTVTEYYGSDCQPKLGCISINGIAAVNLPWKTELYEAEGIPRERYASGGSGTPEWEFTCKNSEGTVSDTCGIGNPGLENSLQGYVVAIFDERFTSKAPCSAFGLNDGLWQGSLTTSTPEGVESLEVKYE
jgi:hypothetical protein